MRSDRYWLSGSNLDASAELLPQTAQLDRVPIRFIRLVLGLQVVHCHPVIQWLRVGYRLRRRASGLRRRELLSRVESGQVVVYT